MIMCVSTKTSKAKLNEHDVIAIRKARANGETIKVLASIYKVSFTAISQASTGKKWRHVEFNTVRKRVAINKKEQPITDEAGLKWCNCSVPKLTHNTGGRGQALCLKCMTPWYH